MSGDKFVSDETLASWFAYHPPSSPAIAEAHERVRALFGDLARELNALLPECEELRDDVQQLRDCLATLVDALRAPAEG